MFDLSLIWRSVTFVLCGKWRVMGGLVLEGSGIRGRHVGERVGDGRRYHVRGEGQVSVSDGRYRRGYMWQIGLVGGIWLGGDGMMGRGWKRWTSGE